LCACLPACLRSLLAATAAASCTQPTTTRYVYIRINQAIKFIAAGDTHFCAISDNARKNLFAWGSNYDGTRPYCTIHMHMIYLFLCPLLFVTSLFERY